MNADKRLKEIRADRSYRTAEVRGIDAESRSIEIAFSSEAEVKRYWGVEVLSHDPSAVVLDRLRGGAPLLVNHDTADQVGVIESVSIDPDRRGRAVVRFGRSARAQEIFDDVQDGIRKHISVGYAIHDAALTEMRGDDEVWTATRWEPFEVSIVPVPADISVGVGRSQPTEPEPLPSTEKREMTTETQESKQPIDAAAEHRKGSDQERTRAKAILEMGEKYGAPELAREFVSEGKEVADFQRALLDHVNGRVQRPLSQQTRDADIGMTDNEARNFSFLKVVRALSDPTDRRAQEDAAFEFEASRAAAEKRSKETGKFAIPSDVLTRAFNTATSGSAAGDTGGYSIATDLLASSFIDILRSRATIMQLGRTIGGLVGNVDIPKQVSAAQGYWMGEDAEATETGIELGEISLTPKTVGAFSEITRKLLQQSSLDVEALVRADLATALALTIDKAGYYGTGTGTQPRGITKYTGINVVDFAVAAKPTYAELVDMETQISLDNADVASMAYVANAGFRGYAKTTLKFSGVPGTLWEPGNTINGYRTEITNQINTGDVIMGNFADLLIGMWGGLDLMVDPYSNSKRGRIRVVVFQDVDFALRRVESFCHGVMVP